MAVNVPKSSAEKVKKLNDAIDALNFAGHYLLGSLNFCEGVIRHQDMNSLVHHVHYTMKELSPTIAFLEKLKAREEGESK